MTVKGNFRISVLYFVRLKMMSVEASGSSPFYVPSAWGASSGHYGPFSY